MRLRPAVISWSWRTHVLTCGHPVSRCPVRGLALPCAQPVEAEDFRDGGESLSLPLPECVIHLRVAVSLAGVL